MAEQKAGALGLEGGEEEEWLGPAVGWCVAESQWGRKEGLLVSAVRGNKKKRMTDRCKQEKRCRNPKRRAEKGETVLVGRERKTIGQKNWKEGQTKFKLERKIF